MTEAVRGEEQATAHIHGICLKTGPPARVGVELEWLVRDAADSALPVPAERIAAAVAAFRAPDAASPDAVPASTVPASTVPASTVPASTVPASTVPASTVHTDPVPASNGSAGPGPAGPGSAGPGSLSTVSVSNGHTDPVASLPSSSVPGILPSGALLTTEPGGQLELSSLPADSLADLVSVTSADLAALRAAVAEEGLELTGIGLDPFRPPRRVLTLPRYAAMEAFFDRDGPWGRQMMCATASVQVCLDAGDDSETHTGYRHRWRLLHAIGPVLVAAFANSPLRDGKPIGWKSARQQVWAHMDPGRTRPPLGDGDLRDGWAAYALDAQVMCVRSEDADWSAPPGLTLRDWIRSGSGGLRAPGPADLDYHLSTLFPPVRPRGHFEIRMIDAQPGDGWVVPLAVTTALLDDEKASEAALEAVQPIWPGPSGDWPAAGGVAGPDDGNPWVTAARCGPEDPEIARASRACFTAARDALARMNAPRAVTTAVDAFTETYVARDRCPADDLLEEVR
jgi:ergothioneine biosynthesis glutamate--cysteine ligase EgtA